MEVKKSDKANLKNKKPMFLQFGIILALLFSLLAFEWSTGERNDSAFDGMSGDAIEEEQIPVTEDEVFAIVEDMPTFKGGDINKFHDWVQKRVRYPELATDNDIQGRVFITFVVETNGTVSGVTVTRSVDQLLDEAAKEAVTASPKWEPGMHRGRPVRVRYSIPIIFQLQ
jgi:protein TonB